MMPTKPMTLALMILAIIAAVVIGVQFSGYFLVKE
jgi:hypothetical protein